MRSFLFVVVSAMGPLARAEATECKQVAQNVYDFFEERLQYRIKRDKLGPAKAASLADEYSKLLGMATQESGVDAAKIAVHHQENHRTKDKDWLKSGEIMSTVSEVRSNIATFLGRANSQMDFGILQMSPDTAIFRDNGSQYVKGLLTDLQGLVDKGDAGQVMNRCGSTALFRDTGSAIFQALRSAGASQCNPVLDVNYGKHSATPVNNRGRVECFAKLVMLCPGLQLDWALHESSRYFGSRGASRKCSSQLENAARATFKSDAKDSAGDMSKDGSSGTPVIDSRH